MENLFKISNQDKLLLIKLVNSESRGESELDKKRVASVVLNRIASKSFPNSMKGVIYQPKQFSGIKTKWFKFDTSDRHDMVVKKNVDQVLKTGAVIDALFFCNPSTSNKKAFEWMNGLSLVAKGKNHWYYK